MIFITELNEHGRFAVTECLTESHRLFSMLKLLIVQLYRLGGPSNFR